MFFGEKHCLFAFLQSFFMFSFPVSFQGFLHFAFCIFHFSICFESFLHVFHFPTVPSVFKMFPSCSTFLSCFHEFSHLFLSCCFSCLFDTVSSDFSFSSMCSCFSSSFMFFVCSFDVCIFHFDIFCSDFPYLSVSNPCAQYPLVVISSFRVHNGVH